MKKILLIIATALVLCACGGGGNKEPKAAPTPEATKELATMSAHEIADILISYDKGLIEAYKKTNKALGVDFQTKAATLNGEIRALYDEGKISDNDMAGIHDLYTFWILENIDEWEQAQAWVIE